MKVIKKLFVGLLLCFIIALSLFDFDVSEMMSAVGITSRYDAGYEAGYLAGLEDGTDSGYKKGYHAGFSAGQNSIKDLYAAKELAKELSSNASKSLSSSSSSVTTYVYITNTGSKSHKANCSYLKSSNKISLNDAKAWGYEPCSRCY